MVTEIKTKVVEEVDFHLKLAEAAAEVAPIAREGSIDWKAFYEGLAEGHTGTAARKGAEVLDANNERIQATAGRTQQKWGGV